MGTAKARHHKTTRTTEATTSATATAALSTWCSIVYTDRTAAHISARLLNRLLRRFECRELNMAETTQLASLAISGKAHVDDFTTICTSQ